VSVSRFLPIRCLCCLLLLSVAQPSYAYVSLLLALHNGCTQYALLLRDPCSSSCVAWRMLFTVAVRRVRELNSVRCLRSSFGLLRILDSLHTCDVTETIAAQRSAEHMWTDLKFGERSFSHAGHTAWDLLARTFQDSVKQRTAPHPTVPYRTAPQRTAIRSTKKRHEKKSVTQELAAAISFWS